MTEQVFKKASDLDPVGYADNLIVVVSNPSIPDGPGKESQRLNAGDIRPQKFTWNPVTHPVIADLVTVKNGDFLEVSGLVTEPVLYNDIHLQNEDLLFITDKTNNLFVLVPNKTKRKMRLTMASYNVSIPEYLIKANDEVLVDVTDGEVSCRLPTIHEDGDEVLFVPLAGNYAINSLYILSSENLAGVTNDPVRVNIDNLPVRCKWSSDLTRWIVTAF